MQNSPKVLGIDAFFKGVYTSEVDSLLEEVLSRYNNIVLVNKFPGSIDSNFSHKSENSLVRFSKHTKIGFAELPIDGAFRTVRNFLPVKKVDNKNYYSFGYTVSELYDSAATNFLMKRGESIQVINYRGNYQKFFSILNPKFYNIEGAKLNFLKNKIVLLGYLGDYSTRLEESIIDKFYTPLNPILVGRSYPDMHGIVVHANIISTIIHERYIDNITDTALFLTIFLILFCNSLLLIILNHRKREWYGGISKIIIVIESIIIFILVIFLFVEYNTKIELKTPLIALIFLPDLVEFYSGIFKINKSRG